MAKEKEKSPAFQWYPKDILSSERVQLMSLSEEGAYRRAIDFCWLGGSIPSDPKALSKLIGKGCSVAIAKVILTMFVKHPEHEDRMIHERLEVSRQQQIAWREKTSYAGKKSGEARRKKLEQELENSSEIVSTKNEQETNVSSVLVETKLPTKTNFPSSSPSPISSTKVDDDDRPPSSILISSFPMQYPLKAKSGMVPADKIPDELQKFDLHHEGTGFTDAKHILNAWGIWCQNYESKLKKIGQKQEQPVKIKAIEVKGPEKFW